MGTIMDDYTPFTVEEVMLALGLEGYIAWEMLGGATRFTPDELASLAAFKGVSVDDMLDIDDTFGIYRDPKTEAKKEIALKMLRKGFDMEIASEITGLPIDRILKLKR